MLQDVLRLGSAKLVLIHDGRIAQLMFTGLLTPELLGGLIRQAGERYGGHTCGWVSDFTGAAVVVPLDDLARITLSTPPGHVLRRPGAFVCTSAAARQFADHSRKVAEAGVFRRAFSDRRIALVWLRARLRAERQGGILRRGGPQDELPSTRIVDQG